MNNIFFKPFIKLIEIIFTWNVGVFKNLGISLIALSLIVSIILLPLYYLAEKIAKKEKDIQDKMKDKIDEFKSVYKGYERHLYIKNVYRLNNYHPIYSLRSLVSLAIQIPFFIGAYIYLQSYVGFDAVSFGMIQDLAKPDALISIGKLTLNILPFIMTFFNLAAGYVYSKNSNFSEKLTIVLVSLFFLLVLYKAPASLLVYWTFNNIFSLVKNILMKKHENKRGVTI